MRFRSVLFAVLAFLFTLPAAYDAAAQVEPGQTFNARVVEVGDAYRGPHTIGRKMTIRLYGTDASESAQPSGSLTAQDVAFELRYGTPESAPAVPQYRGSRDKMLHGLVSMTWTVGAYYGGTELADWPHGTSLGVAAGSAVTLGLLKELNDRSKIPGRFSGADMIINLIGTGLGVGLVLGVERG